MSYRNYASNGTFGEPPQPAPRACNNLRIPERTEIRPFAIGRFACAQRRNDRFVILNRAITRALEMLNNTVSARRDPERALAALRHVATHAHILKGVRGDAADVLPAILRRFEQRAL